MIVDIASLFAAGDFVRYKIVGINADNYRQSRFNHSFHILPRLLISKKLPFANRW